MCDFHLFFSIGYPVVTLGFGFKTYVSYKMRLVSNENPKYLDARKKCCIYPKLGLVWFYYWWVMISKDEDRMAHSVDPDETALVGAVWSGFTLLAQTCLSKNLGSLGYNLKLYFGNKLW